MNGRGRRNKGLGAERELAGILLRDMKVLLKTYGVSNYVLHPQVKELCRNGIHRNTGQSQLGGSDITTIPYLLIEVKRCETLSIPAWWRQVNRACRDYNYRNKHKSEYSPIEGVVKIPCVAYRQNRKKWRFILPARALLMGATVGDKEFFLKECNDMLEVNLECFQLFVKSLLVRKGETQMIDVDKPVSLVTGG